MAKFLIDTDVLIDHLRGHTKARDYLHKRWAAGDTLYCSVISRAELIAGMHSEEEDSIRALLASLHEIPIDKRIAEGAGAYRRQFAKSHGVLLPDALIASSAKSIDARLITLNAKHFPRKDVPVATPYQL